jgi:hypothetical protein
MLDIKPDGNGIKFDGDGNGDSSTITPIDTAI